MIGKKNIVFGFFFLLLTAALGPFMIVNFSADLAASEADKQQKVGALQQARDSGYEVDLEKLNAEQIAKANTDALLALSARLNSRVPIDEIKTGPHAHGNLEAILNILVGVLLGFLAIPVVFKQLISWSFILGTLGHSGLLFLAVAVQLPWAGDLLGSWFGYIGPSLILIGLLLAAIGAAMGFNGGLVKDKKQQQP
ncbi:MAG: hypothetical protein A2150_05940 [Candidatus Muproteobacteria bacterium RBG_16_64_11]|uniref:Uncharacterized protein n=1 Tax=Candidatus Muproteobacteria bacterium RBG_16_64_11 TaxID=1817758 RepID=A0A1F6TI82_9PROT|nr:MAG: hypothetical protein A2150_05940 [Candidatus Muproteobacteria bacterium RBG_16_64_11]